MRFELTGRHLSVTPQMRRLVQQQLAHVERLLGQSAVSAQVVVTREKFRHNVEITLHARGEHFLHAQAAARDWNVALDTVMEKIEHQAQKLTGKWKGRKRRIPSVARSEPAAAAAQPGDDDEQVRIIRARRYAVKPMSVDDAAMEVGKDRNSFLVFRNATNDSVTVLYRRPDGHLGLIEPEA